MQFCAKAQNCIFRTVEQQRGKVDLENSRNLQNGNKLVFHKIALCNKPNGLLGSYPLIIEDKVFSAIDTLKSIDELLKFEGDTNLCVLKVTKYNNRSSNFWIEEIKDYSIQLEALYIINLLALEKPFVYAPIPALKNIKTKEKATISGEIIRRAFEAYRNWFNIVKKQGLQKTKSDEYYPLDNSGISWF
jgi:hypothetical protein